MSSILTNNSAMVALETLRYINRDLSDVQNQISTGKKISSAMDNSAIWAVATTMESDNGGFKQISDSLNLGSATVGVARGAAEQIGRLWTISEGSAKKARQAKVKPSQEAEKKRSIM